jgi:hypothetical protein
MTILAETEEEKIFEEKWVRKLIVATLYDLGLTCPGHCNHQIAENIGGRHCGTLSRSLNRGTKSIFRKLRELSELGYIQILAISAGHGSETQQRRAIQKCYRLTEKGQKKAKEFENEFTYNELI